jgi:hypothetical protein
LIQTHCWWDLLHRSILGSMADLTEHLPLERYLCELDEKRRKEVRGEAGRSCSLFNTLLHKIMHNQEVPCRGRSRRLQSSSPMIPSQRQEWTLRVLENPNQCRRCQRKNGPETPWRKLLVGDEHKLRHSQLKSRQSSDDGHWTSASERHNVLEHRKAPRSPQRQRVSI